MELKSIRTAAQVIDRAFRSAKSAKLASDELDLTFPDEAKRRRDLGRTLADQASEAVRLLVAARSELKRAIDELAEKRAEGERSAEMIEDGAPTAGTPPGQKLQWMMERKGVESAESGTPGKLYVLTTGPGPRYEVVAKYGSDELDSDGRAKFGRGHRFKNSHLARRAAEKHYHWLTAGPPLNPYQDQRAAVEAPRMTGPRALIEPGAVEDHARKLAQAERGLRVVPDADAELAEIDRELDELETAPRTQVVTQWRDRKPERKTGRQWWPAEATESESTATLLEIHQQGSPEDLDLGELIYEHGLADRDMMQDPPWWLTPLGSRHSGLPARPEPSEAWARVHKAQEAEAEATREHSARMRAQRDREIELENTIRELRPARPGSGDYSAATYKAREKLKALERSFDRMAERVSNAYDKGTQAQQRKADAGLKNAEEKLARARAKHDKLTRADAVAWAIKEYDRRESSTPVPRGWDAPETTISEEILPTPRGVTVERGYWQIPYDGDLAPPPVYPGLPVTQPIGAHKAAGVIVDVNKTGSRISVRLYGTRKPEKYSWRKGRGGFIKVGDSGGSRLGLGKAVEYNDPGV